MAPRSIAPGIELDRQFLDLPKSTEESDVDSLIDAARVLGKAVAWPELLSSRYVVVLGEAGTGKSTEFRRRAAVLTATGKTAFFVELVDLAAGGLRSSLLPDAEDRLDSWTPTADEAVFFLDSLDEAKLQRRTLREALRRLLRDLREQWPRVRLVVSCRVSDWRDSDRMAVEEVVPEGQKSDIRVLQIAPLDDDRIVRMARHVGVKDPDGFVRAISACYAQAFAGRPLDVEWLGAYWTRHGRIGTLHELVAANVDEKLTEQARGRAVTLSLAKARAGAEALAGIAMLTRRLSILLPGETDDLRRAQSAIDTREVLPNWAPGEVDELLRSALFDESTYGRVRFHLRAVQDYLAARWLYDLRAAGLPIEKLLELFLIEEAGERVIPQQLGPVLAWLCLRDEGARTEVIREAPALLIAFGDPSGLPETDRAQVLRSYATSFKNRTRLFNDFEDASLERFATPSLEGSIRSLLAAEPLSDELGALLFEIVERGQIRGCLPEALRVAVDIDRQPTRARIAAIRAIVALGDERHRRGLMSLLDVTKSWPQDVAGAFVRGLYPETLGVEGLVHVLDRCERKPKNLATLLQGVLEFEVPKLGDSESRLHLLARLQDVVRIVDADGKVTIVPNREWLLRPLAHLLGAVLDEVPAGAAQPNAVRQALDLFRLCDEQGMRIYFGVDQAREAVARHPEVRRGLFWQRVAEHRLQTGRVPRSPFEMRYRHDIFELSSGDASWLAKDAVSRADVRERLLAFDALAFLPRSAKDNEQYLDMLREVSRARPELQRRLERLLRRTPVQHPAEGQLERSLRARAMRLQRRRQEDRRVLEADLESIRSGANLNALMFLLERAKADGASNRWRDAPVEALREQYGDDIAQAALLGWRSSWRACEPSLPHERERNTTPWTVIVGLVGLTKDFESGLEAKLMSNAEVEKATRYAANELNGFPEWFEKLAELHPESVRAALRPTLAADYFADQDVHGVLAKLSWAPASVKSACAPAVLDLILTKDPPTVKALEEVLGLVLSVKELQLSGLDASLAGRCRDAQGDVPRLAVWWLVWACRNGGAAMDFLETLVRGAERKLGHEVILEICHRIHEGVGRAPIALRHDLPALTRLVPLVYEFIELKDDIDHEDVFSPGRRDNAQEVRSLLVRWVAQMPGPEAVTALRRIADDPRVAAVREWILHQADERAVANVEGRRADVADFLITLCRDFGTAARDHVARPPHASGSVKILFLGSNPLVDDPNEVLGVDEEVREIEGVLRSVPHRDAFRLKSRWAVRPTDLQEMFREERPTIVHFSGHGAGAGGLYFHSATRGQESTVDADTLCEVFRLHGCGVRVVVLNACDSNVQAEALVKVIDFAVGMRDSVDDEAAKVFAAAFYQALGHGETIAQAFEQGRLALGLAGMPDQVDIPVLVHHPEVDPGTTTLVQPGEGRT